MRCEAVRDALPALARGTLPAAEAAAVRDHIAGCDACADAWSVVGTLSAARVSAPPALAGRVSDELERRRAAGLLGRRGVARPVRWLAGAGAAIAAVIALLLAWPVTRDDEGAHDAPADGDAVADPFLDEALFGATTPIEAELDGLIRVALNDSAGMLDDVVIVSDDAAASEAPLALDAGSPAGDWPGADGVIAGVVTTDDLSYDELELLLEEMET